VLQTKLSPPRGSSRDMQLCSPPPSCILKLAPCGQGSEHRYKTLVLRLWGAS
jgi:hypothetical protein